MKASDPGPATGTGKAFSSFVPWLILLVLMVLTRPYRGIHHDGYLYAAQTLRRIDPQNLAGDVFFEFGNQDSFTIFTALYAPFVRVMGLSHADSLFWALGLVCWFAALAALAGHLFSDRNHRLLAMAAAILLSARYGNAILIYGEGYVVPRPFAEAAGLLALYLGLKGRYASGAVFTLVAGVLHPITGLSVAALWLWFAVRSFVLWFAFVFVAGLAGLCLGWLGVAPLTWLFQSIDPDWAALLSLRVSMAFPSTWAGSGVLTLCLPLLSLAIVLTRGAGPARDLAKGVLIVGLATTLAALIGADLLANRFLTSLQLWRGLLWVALVGNFLSIAALLVLPAGGWSRRIFVLACLFSVVEFHINQTPFLSSATGGLALITLLFEIRARRTAANWAGRLCAVPAVFAGVTLLSLSVGKFGTDVGLRLGLILLMLIVFLWVMMSRDSVSRPLGAVVVALAAVILTWDARTPWQHYVLGDAAVPEDVQSAVAGRTVYWDDALDLVWFKLQVPQFYACRQQGGRTFFRAQAMEIARRAEILRALNGQEFWDAEGAVCTAKADLDANGPTRRDQFVDACEKLPELDLIVMRTKLEELPRLSWSMPAPDRDIRTESEEKTEFYFYFCEDFRGN
ncbi:MAG: hypothetical protein HKP40_13205 [Litoreibacter sp.]|nr:hypothetical protein [Litoreibacter sp.]